MKFWTKVWGTGDSHSGEQQIAPLERISHADGARLGAGDASREPPHDHGALSQPTTDGPPFLSAAAGAAKSETSGQFRRVILTEDERPVLSYEFFACEQIPLRTWPSGSSAYATQDPAATDGHACVAGSGVRWRASKSKALFSEVLEPVDGGPRFQTRPVSPLLQDTSTPSGVVHAANFFRSWPSWQNQKGPEWVTWPGNDGRSCCTSTRGFGPGLAHMAGFLGCLTLPSSSGFLTSYANDVGKDVAPAFYEAADPRVRTGAPALPDYIDWRRAAVHVAEGGRKFFVLTDSHGYIHVYPVREYGADFRALTSDQIKSYLPAYPAWTASTAGTDSRSAGYRECFLWSFNADATRMVGVPFSEQEGRAWLVRKQAGMAPTADFTKFFLHNMGNLTLLTPSDSEGSFLPPDYTPGWWQVPGLVQLSLQVVVDGTGDMDYHAVITTIEDSPYLANGYRYYVDAGFLLRNKRMGDQAEATLGAPADTLLTAEIELFWEPPATQARIGRNTANDDGVYSYFDVISGTTQYNFEIHPGLPLFDVRAAPARAQIYGLRNRASLFYTVRRHDTQQVIRRFRLCSSFGARPRDSFAQHVMGGFNQLNYADLRSLTFMFGCAHSSDGTTLNGKTSTAVYVWNELQGLASTFVGTDAAALADTRLEDGSLPSTQIPGADVGNSDVAMYFLQLASVYLVRLSFFRSFPVHPHGHWASTVAAANDPTGKLDMIQAYLGSGAPAPRGSHLQAYNEAFAQTRALDFHGLVAGDLDIAPWASAGIWRLALP